jgi:hypothetical protein
VGRFPTEPDSLPQPEARQRLERRAFDQDAIVDDLMAAAEWTRAKPGPFVDTEGAAQLLGVTPQYVGRLAAQGRLPWLPTGRLGGGTTRVYRRAQLEAIARARTSAHTGTTSTLRQ